MSECWPGRKRSVNLKALGDSPERNCSQQYNSTETTLFLFSAAAERTEISLKDLENMTAAAGLSGYPASDEPHFNGSSVVYERTKSVCAVISFTIIRVTCDYYKHCRSHFLTGQSRL